MNSEKEKESLKINTDPEKIEELLTRGVEEIFVKDLISRKQLYLYLLVLEYSKKN
jgi:hypothetical protein